MSWRRNRNIWWNPLYALGVLEGSESFFLVPVSRSGESTGPPGEGFDTLEEALAEAERYPVEPGA
jgi:hypothetical protein